MKTTLRFYAIVFSFFFACSNPDKENKINEADSLNNANDTTQQRPILADTVNIDTLTAKVKFNKEDSTTYFVLANYFKDSLAQIPRTDLQIVDSTCAVIIYPTDEQLDNLKFETGDKFMELADAYSYYQGRAIEMLDSIDIGTVHGEKRYITFKRSKSKLWELDVRKEGAPAWNLIFFKPTKEPQIVSITELSKERIMTYFDKKAE
jgi:hypothetical protein